MSEKFCESVALHCPRVVLKKGHIEMPVEKVLYALMASCGHVVVGRFAEGFVADVVPCCLGRLDRFLGEIRKIVGSASRDMVVGD